jgi:hypothetical protein
VPFGPRPLFLPLFLPFFCLPFFCLCRYLHFESEWWVFAAEFALIAHYTPERNASGSGSKTPGAGRTG